LIAEVFASLSDEHSPLTPSITSTTTPSLSNTTATTTSSKSRKATPPNFVKILAKQKKGITYELILEVSYYIRTSDGYVFTDHLKISLTPLRSWLERFIQDGGMQIIAKELGAIHKKQNRYLVCF
jgi:hypothetical protein